MLSSKLLPEMEVDDNLKREQLLLGMQNLPIPTQIEKLKARIDMIAAACESAEKVIADTRKAYGLDTRQKASTIPNLDRAFSAKIQEKENLLRAAVNHGEGLRLPADQRQAVSSHLPSHLVDVLPVSDAQQTYNDGSGMYSKNPPMMSSNQSSQGTPQQASGAQLLGRSVPSPSTATVTSSFDNTASPMQYANSPRSGTNIMNAPSPQQQTLQQQHLQQQRKMMQLAPQQQQQQQQLLVQQQYRQSAMQGLTQNQLPQLHDMQTQAHQKFSSLQGQNQMQFSQPLASQQYQARQLAAGHMQHAIGQSQLSQGGQLNRHIGQFSGAANTALFNAAQNSPNSPVISNMSATMSSQPLIPRMQFPLGGANPQRALPSQMLSDQMFNMGANQAGMMSLPQQQVGAFGNMSQNPQNLQQNMVPLQNAPQNLQNFQQRQPNQQ